MVDEGYSATSIGRPQDGWAISAVPARHTAVSAEPALGRVLLTLPARPAPSERATHAQTRRFLSSRPISRPGSPRLAEQRRPPTFTV